MNAWLEKQQAVFGDRAKRWWAKRLERHKKRRNPQRRIVLAILAVAAITAVPTIRWIETYDRYQPSPHIDTAAPSMPVGSLPKASLGGLQYAPATGQPKGCRSSPTTPGLSINDYTDDPSRPLLPTAGRPSNILLNWLNTSYKAGITEAAGNPGARPLSRALQAARNTDPCSKRYVGLNAEDGNISDNRKRALAAQLTMVQLMADSQTRQAYIQSLAQAIGSQPNADGLSLDLRSGLPARRTDMSSFAASLRLPSNLHDNTKLEAITSRFTNLVCQISSAMHAIHRHVQVVVTGRSEDGFLGEEVLPYYFDYERLAACSDQVVVDITNYSYANGDPGPVTLASWAEDQVRFVSKRTGPAKVAVLAAAYAYDWQTDEFGQLRFGTVARQLSRSQLDEQLQTTPTQLMGSGIDGTHYRYRDTSGVVHDIWDELPALAALSRRLHVPMLAGPVGNIDAASMRFLSTNTS